MADNPCPIFGLPPAEWKAALTALEAVTQSIDDRVMEAKVLKDGCLYPQTCEILGGLNARGHRVGLRKGERGWEVAEVLQWGS